MVRCWHEAGARSPGGAERSARAGAGVLAMCVFGGSERSERGMWARFIVVASPIFQNEPHVRDRSEQRLIQQFVAQATIEGFDKTILLRLSRGNIAPADTAPVGPVQDRVRCQFGAIVTNDRFGTIMDLRQTIQLARNTGAGERCRQPAPGRPACNHQRHRECGTGDHR